MKWIIGGTIVATVGVYHAGHPAWALTISHLILIYSYEEDRFDE